MGVSNSHHPGICVAIPLSMKERLVMKSLKWVMFVLSASIASPQVMAAEIDSYSKMGAGSFKCGEAFKKVEQTAQAHVDAAVKKAATTEDVEKK